MKDGKTNRSKSIETVEPVGLRVLIRKDEDRKQTRSGIHLPDKMEIPTITGRIVSISAQVEADEKYPIARYDRVLFHPKHAIPVDLEADNRLFVVPIEDVVAVFRREGAAGDAQGKAAGSHDAEGPGSAGPSGGADDDR